jgi:hypothetical protein
LREKKTIDVAGMSRDEPARLQLREMGVIFVQQKS